MSDKEKVAKTADKKTKQKKAKTPLEKKKARRRVVNTIMGAIIFCSLLGVACGVSTIAMILQKSDVVLDLADLGSSESSFIYDAKGNEIARLGLEDRVNITYNDLPQVVVDAFVSVEDSRYFEHPGFDMPRFAKATLENLKSFDFSQGGSTLTMQVIKNSYFAVDTIAEKSIPRKVQEIYYSLKINNLLTKGKVLELYVNKVNFGYTARGIEVAAEYYFNKDVQELSLVEAAMLAGIVQAPNDYNPYYHPDWCQERTGDVLYLMNYHGYISDEEYHTAEKVNVIDLVSGSSETDYKDGTTIPNQCYIDTVVQELEDVYDINVYTDAVKVYTAMNQKVQKVCDDASNGEIVKFKDNLMNYACAIVENNTGLIVGMSGGRGYDTVRGFNYATDSRTQPGSTMKAILTYPMAFEYGGISTTTYVNIEPKVYLDGSGIQITEDDGKYHGDVNVMQAFCSSYNVAAIKFFRMARNAAGDTAIKDYLRNIGMDESMVQNFNEQFAIGGMDCLISPLQLAAAGSCLMSGGRYTTPHTITRIEFINSTREPIVPNYNSVQAVSQGAAYLTTLLMEMNIDHSKCTEGTYPNNTRLVSLKRSYPVYAKTGTTSLPSTFYRKYPGTPTTGAKDQWLLIATNKFTIGDWIGYDYSKGMTKTSYITIADRRARRDTVIMGKILDVLASEYGASKTRKSVPADVTSIKSIRGLTPYTALPSYADSKNETTGLILSKFAKVVEYEKPDTIASVENAIISLSGRTVTIKADPYPDADMTKAPNMKYSFGGKKIYDPKIIDGVIQYNYVIYDSAGNVLDHKKSSSATYSYTLQDLTYDETLTVSVYYAYSIAPVQSNTITKTITIPGTHIPDPTPDPDPNPEP